MPRVRRLGRGHYPRIHGGVRYARAPTAAYVPAPRPSRASFATIGIAADLREAARKAVESLVAWLVDTRGFDRGAAYVLCSVAADLRISEIVNAPHPLVSALLPLDVFEDH